MWSKCSRCSKRTISRNAVQYSHSPSAWGRDYGCFTFYSSVHCPAGRPDRYSASASFLLFWTEEALESAVTALFAFVGCEAFAAIFSEPNSRMPQLPPCSCFSCEKFSSPYPQGSAAARQCTKLRRLAICIRRLPIPAGQFELHLRLLLQLRQRLVH